MGVRVSVGAGVKVETSGVSVGTGVCLVGGVDVIVGVAVNVGIVGRRGHRRVRRRSICGPYRVSSGW